MGRDTKIIDFYVRFWRRTLDFGLRIFWHEKGTKERELMVMEGFEAGGAKS